MKYDFSAIESKWQKRWEEAHIFEAQDASDKPKFYGLVEFPYPSGVGDARRAYQGILRTGGCQPQAAYAGLQCSVSHRI